MAIVTSSPTPLLSRSSPTTSSSSPFNLRFRLSVHIASRRRRRFFAVASHLCNPETPTKLDKSELNVAEAISEDELLAAARLRIRSFYNFRESVGIEDHKRYLVEREFEALKERVAGKRAGFRRVSCINATLPLSHVLNISDDLSSTCKFSKKGEDRVLVGSLDLNQCLSLPDELTGMKPQGIGADFARAYLSNVCVAEELHRNGLGYELIAKSKMVAEDWGISDLYVHVAVDNEPAKRLYMKSGFVYESDEPAWQARFLDRPRRVLLWIHIPNTLDL
ncbi:GCN5-related N-acetyltransferase 7, chloroplastic [Sarracenia purpurea var. burkii]